MLQLLLQLQRRRLLPLLLQLLLLLLLPLLLRVQLRPQLAETAARRYSHPRRSRPSRSRGLDDVEA